MIKLIAVVVLSAVFSFTYVEGSLAQSTQDTLTGKSVSKSAHRQNLEGQRYTTDDFAALPDNIKKYIYLNRPALLPEDFNPMDYADLFHPEGK